MREALCLRDEFSGAQVLVLGKGPSLTREGFMQAARGRKVVGINQASASFPVDLMFAIDIEPFREIATDLLKTRCSVLLPWRPNQRSWGGKRSTPLDRTLADLVLSDPCLAELDRQDRLYYFHTRRLNGAPERNVFPPNLVSVSSLLQVLAAVGVKDVTTLGIDGGVGYSSELKRSALPTQLHGGYSKQFPIIRSIALSRGLRMERANEVPINIYIGCEAEQRLSARVLEHSILKHTSHPVRIQRLYECISADRKSGGRTPFSMQRFMIPELNKRAGLAIYLDSDMLVFGDVKELIETRDRDSVVSFADAPPGSGRSPQFSVMVIDCSRAEWNSDSINELARDAYEAAMFGLTFEPSQSCCLPYRWNSLERMDSETRLLHFTDMDRQPWLATDNPLAPIWMDALFSAIKDGQVLFDDILQDVQRGWIRPGVMWQVEHGEREAGAIPRTERLKDQLFVAPHTVARFTRRKSTPVLRASLAVAKRMYHWVKG